MCTSKFEPEKTERRREKSEGHRITSHIFTKIFLPAFRRIVMHRVMRAATGKLKGGPKCKEVLFQRACMGSNNNNNSWGSISHMDFDFLFVEVEIVL